MGNLLLLALMIGCLMAVGCSSPVRHGRNIPDPVILEMALLDLGGKVDRGEALLLSTEAVSKAVELAVDYSCVRPALWHNALVNAGRRPRGLCHHWADDMHEHLAELELSTLQISRVAARKGHRREHNALIVTAKDTIPGEGLILDAWRGGGRLHWVVKRYDRYVWEPLAEPF